MQQKILKFYTHQIPCTKLTVWFEEVEIVGAQKSRAIPKHDHITVTNGNLIVHLHLIMIVFALLV